MSNSNTLQSTLIFIPDISGFTKFINSGEIDHSIHIITELLQIIVDSNTLNLKISEIEGDAVLFYRNGKEPSFEEITDQVKTMFLNFHSHLKYYENDRICQCGACSNAHNLTLKFIYHYGQTTTRKIDKYKKLFGPDVTLAHRLLKNDIQDNEYLLLTKSPDQTRQIDPIDWVTMKQNKVSYENIGEISYNYFSLGPLKFQLENYQEQIIIEKYKNPISNSIIINNSIDTVHSVLSDIKIRPEWVFGLKSVIDDGPHLPTIGSKHQCITTTSKLDFETMNQNIEEGYIEYIEKTESIGWLGPIFLFFTMKRIAKNKILFNYSLHYKQTIFSKLYLDIPFRLLIYLFTSISLKRLKKYIENLPQVQKIEVLQ